MSQSSRILAVLSDGEGHSTAELYRRVGGMILHSRVAELRKRGYRISCEYVGGSGAEAYVYTLEGSGTAVGYAAVSGSAFGQLREPERAAPEDCQALPGEPVRSLPTPTADSLTESDATSAPSEVFTGQLSLLVAA